MKIKWTAVPANPALIPAACMSREAAIWDALKRQVWGDPAKPGSGIDLTHPDADKAVRTILFGAYWSLRACGSTLIGGAL